jgi:hypothetical protein
VTLSLVATFSSRVLPTKTTAGLGWRSPWTPWQAPPIPAGRYDPALDAPARAAQRGYGDVAFDVSRQGSRDVVDYGLGREDSLRQQGRGYADLDRSYACGNEDLTTNYQRTDFGLGQQLTRGTEDLTTSRNRLGEDYSREIGMLQRAYQRLEGRQNQAFNASGLRGGAQLTAAARRAENMAIDRQPLDTSYQRGTQDISTQQGRLEQDVGTQRAWNLQDYNTGGLRLGQD